MSSGPGEEASSEEVGSVGEEAARLLGALSDWARDGGTDLPGGVREGWEGMAGQAASAARRLADHVDTGAAECTWCPLCRAVHAVRTPEVRDHLVAAGSSLVQAVAGFLAASAQPRPAAPDVEHIDLDDGDWPEEDR